MFPIGRYDPTRDRSPTTNEKGDRHERKKKRKRRRKSQEGQSAENDDKGNDGPAEKSSLRVIAPDETDGGPTAVSNKAPAKTEEEAFDDLDLFDEGVDDEPPTSSQEEPDVVQASSLPQHIQTALHLSSLSVEQAGKAMKLAPFLVQNLKRDGFQNFFPIQALVIPNVMASERHAHVRARDICITSPTGSGKTLAYLLPILNSLANRQIRRLRALVVLPSRDLANQVFHVFQHYVQGSDLKVGLSIGQSDFVAEQVALTVDPDQADSPEMAHHRLLFDPGNIDLTLKAFGMGTGINQDRKSHVPRDGLSAIDILVCTPGRLVDHLDNTPGFTLQHLRFLVVDEADRLLSQRYHNWIDRVIDGANSASVAAWRQVMDHDNQLPPLQSSPDGCSFVLEPITWRRGGVQGDDSDFNNNQSYFATAASVCQPVQLRKILASATLTRDPQKLNALRLVNPQHFDARQLADKGDGSGHKFSMPDELEEYIIECTAEQKPLVLLALLLERLQGGTAVDRTSKKNLIVIFTQSVDSTHRLARLLQILWATAGYGDPSAVVEFSSALNQKERSSLLQRCNSSDKNNDISVVVCSDGMSRGMDLEYISAVVNYDVPCYAKTYVHRCGRTARAGKKGVAYSLLKGSGQVGQFTKMRQLIQKAERVQSTGIQKQLVCDALPKYRQAVRALRDVLEAEENGELKDRTQTLLPEYIPQ